MKPSSQLVRFLDSTLLPWMHWDKKKQKLIVVVDNHLMQTYRACPGNFFLANVEGYHKKSALREDDKERIWNLDFGIVLHKMIEIYYQNFRNQGFDPNFWAVERAIKEDRERLN